MGGGSDHGIEGSPGAVERVDAKLHFRRWDAHEARGLGLLRVDVAASGGSVNTNHVSPYSASISSVLQATFVPMRLNVSPSAVIKSGACRREETTPASCWRLP
jgi:hypothetical protein